jgi:hypothetical protein
MAIVDEYRVQGQLHVVKVAAARAPYYHRPQRRRSPDSSEVRPGVAGDGKLFGGIERRAISAGQRPHSA